MYSYILPQLQSSFATPQPHLPPEEVCDNFCLFCVLVMMFNSYGNVPNVSNGSSTIKLCLPQLYTEQW